MTGTGSLPTSWLRKVNATYSITDGTPQTQYSWLPIRGKVSCTRQTYSSCLMGPSSLGPSSCSSIGADKHRSSGPYPNVPSIFTPFNVTEQALSTQAIGYWTSFARSSEPSSHRPVGQSEVSPSWSSSEAGRLVIQEGTGNTKMEARTAAYEARCRFWNEIGPEIGL